MRSPSLPGLLLVLVALLGLACSTGGTSSTEIEIVDGTIDTELREDDTPEPQTDQPANSDSEPGPDAAEGDDNESGEMIDDRAEFAVDAEALIGPSWTLLFGGGPGGNLVAIDGWPITITFDGQFLRGAAGCNDYGTRYVIDGDRIALDEVGSEEEGCDPFVQEAATIYLEALAKVDRIDVLADEIVLSGNTAELVYRRDEPPPVDELTNNVWVLEATLQNGVETTARGEPATLSLDRSLALGATTGCRSIFGTYELFGARLTFIDFSVQGSCPNALFAQDNLVTAVLSGFTAEVDGESLTLSSEGNQGLRYRAATDDELAGIDIVDVPSNADQLAGVTWTFVGSSSFSGPLSPAAIEAAGPQTITLTVNELSFSGRVFCKTYRGQMEIATSRWTFIDPVAEPESCGPERDAIASAYLEALQRMSEFGFQPGGNSLITVDNESIGLRFIRAGS